MRVLLVNNFVRGGSGVDGVVRMEREGLQQRGHEIGLFARDNHELDAAVGVRRLRLLASCLYSWESRAALRRLLDSQAMPDEPQSSVPDLVHVHNTVPLLSGAVWDSLAPQPVPVVLHLHNYRAFCLSSYLYRDGADCDECVGTAFLACFVHGCYRRSRVQSGALVVSRWTDMAKGRKWGDSADAYIACSDWIRERHVSRGLDPERIWLVRNAAQDHSRLVDAVVKPEERRRRLAFVGSLIDQKGIFKALALAHHLPDFEIHFFGDGEDRPALEQAVARERLQNVVLRGVRRGQALAEPWSESFLTLAPSLWDEPFPLVAPESLSLAIPVLTTGRGGLRESVTDGGTGIIDSFREPGAVAARVRRLWEDQDAYASMCRAARETYEHTYTPDVFLDRLEGAFREIKASYPRFRAAVAGAGRAR